MVKYSLCRWLWVTILVLSGSVHASTLCISPCPIPPDLSGGSVTLTPDPGLPPVSSNSGQIHVLAYDLIYSGNSDFSITSNASVIVDLDSLNLSAAAGKNLTIIGNTLTIVGDQDPLPSFLSSIGLSTGYVQQLSNSESQINFDQGGNLAFLEMTQAVNLSINTAQDVYIVSKSRLFSDAVSPVPLPSGFGLLLSGLIPLVGRFRRGAVGRVPRPA